MEEYILGKLPTVHIEQDPNQPRRDLGTPKEEKALTNSIKKYGIEEPIAVTKFEDERYVIIDGHRRYICAQKLGFEEIPCRIYPHLNSGELEGRRYLMQNLRRRWKPMERSDALQRIKNGLGFATNKELAQYLGIGESNAAASLQLRHQKLTYIELMEKYDLAESYRFEFVKLMPKLRKIREFEINQIMINLFERVQHRVIRSSKSLRKLGPIFLRGKWNEEEIYNFLIDPDMTVDELQIRTNQLGFASLTEQLIQGIAGKKQEGVEFSSKETALLEQLKSLLSQML